ncbi:GNAT family N-acetyltransferase [Chryseolinea sp. H1M3-3]|uniref:GNAT family N-acetyltransferase n=1 Tax=Chryseolinea sp. H1M3-3 TaxID=3034144 RepID=UPI0023EE1BF6|nr:GNAT family N-acetyltransferase [Chryseolinea sp. H1M3-3]
MMNEIQLRLEQNGKGAFIIEDAGERVAEMEIGISGNNLMVYHTEVAEELKGQGIAKDLLSKMVEYARQKQLKVVPLCQYVSAQFNRHPDQYDDIWNRHWRQ